MPIGWVLSKALSSDARVCSHCGGTGLYPHPGVFGDLGGILGRVRCACRDCRRHTWLRPDAVVLRPPPDEPALDVPCPLNAPALLDALDALDVEAAGLPSPRTDLRALDEALARGPRGLKPSRAARGGPAHSPGGRPWSAGEPGAPRPGPGRRRQRR